MPRVKKKQIRLANELGKELCKALGLNPDKTCSITIIVDANEPVIANVTMWGDERLLDVDWNLAKAEKQEAD